MSEPLLLVVDDAPDVGLLAQRFGRRAGHAVVVRPDAESAWDYLQHERRPDLVLLDLNLPGASGADLCRRLRAVPAFADLRVALLCHWDRPQDIARGLDAGADYVVSKDLLGRPEGWSARLAEILPPAPGRPPEWSLPWGSTAARPADAARDVNRALAVAARAPLGPETVRLVVRRAASETGAESRLTTDGLGLDLERVADGGSPELIRAFAAACAAQVWSLLGSAGSAAFRAALADGAPAGAEPPSPP